MLSHLMATNPSPYFDFTSIFPQDQQNRSVCPSSLNVNLPNSKLDDSPTFSGQFHSAFAYDESGEYATRSEESPGSGSGSSLEEAQNSKHGQEGRRRGVGERGINKSENTVYKGVRKRKGGRWVSEIREPGKKTRIWLGTFSTPEMAARAYDVAAFNLKTPCAYLNFPEHVSSLPILTSRSPKDIQESAATTAAALRGVASSRHMGRIGGLVATPTLDKASTSSSTEQQKQLPQSTILETKASSLIDEDMIFDMPNVLADMAEGLMITPPLHYLEMATNADNNAAWDRIEDISLWNL